MRCVIDCRCDRSLGNDYLALNMWGRPPYEYVIEEVVASHSFDRIEVLTDSCVIADEVSTKQADVEVVLASSSGDTVHAAMDGAFVISGRAPLITACTIRNVLAKWRRGCSLRSSKVVYEPQFDASAPSMLGGERLADINAFMIITGNEDVCRYVVPEQESLVINTDSDFELALVLMRKRQRRRLLDESVRKRIDEKRGVFGARMNGPSVCFIGHSQLDQWNIEEIAGLKVRNCAVSGISSFGYDELVLSRGLLICDIDDTFVVMHGTNDIVDKHTLDEITQSVRRTIAYIRSRNEAAPILFLSCAHTNGRLDRSNEMIDLLNDRLRDNLGTDVVWLSTDVLDDRYGRLSGEYTTDGLHLNDRGYCVLESLVASELVHMHTASCGG